MIKIHISFPLIEGILKTNFDEKELFKEKKRLEKYFEQNDVVKQVETITGFNHEGNIDIWLINGSYISSPNPNLLAIGENMIFDLYCLITHNLLFENDFYDNYFTDYGIAESALEATVYFVAEKFVKVDKENKFIKYIWDVLDQLDFDNRTIKEQTKKIKKYISNC